MEKANTNISGAALYCYINVGSFCIIAFSVTLHTAMFNHHVTVVYQEKKTNKPQDAHTNKQIAKPVKFKLPSTFPNIHEW